MFYPSLLVCQNTLYFVFAFVEIASLVKINPARGIRTGENLRGWRRRRRKRPQEIKKKKKKKTSPLYVFFFSPQNEGFGKIELFFCF